jgi:hypothetical protein
MTNKLIQLLLLSINELISIAIGTNKLIKWEILKKSSIKINQF